jgi:hypothetical protein
MLAFRTLSLQSAVHNGRIRDPFFHDQRRALRSESSAADVVDGGLWARAILIRPSTHGKALSGSMQAKAACHWPAASAARRWYAPRDASRPEIHRAFCQPGSAITVPSCSSRSSAVRASSCETSSSFSASGISSSVGSSLQITAAETAS